MPAYNGAAHLRAAIDSVLAQTHADFELVENGETLHVVYKGSEPPPDTFKDNAQALAMGVYKHDGVFYANELQAKCASKYAPQQQQPGAAPAAQQPSKGY